MDHNEIFFAGPGHLMDVVKAQTSSPACEFPLRHDFLTARIAYFKKYVKELPPLLAQHQIMLH
ncbi:hypothetical protein [Dyadobacter sp. OTU695]|uniref:hypothetical protein n=1 Tax=Dyadobacter sp. OTU695 TaxID=3043860 RepID=UPI00313C755E